MNYLGQPVFLFAPNWDTAIERSLTFELNPEDIGFGSEYFVPTANWTVNGWTFDLELDSDDSAAYDAFVTALVGRANGFWLPIPLEAAQITAAASTSVFSIAAQSLSTFWNDRPDIYLLFTFPDGTQAAAQIQSVVPAGATETVTLTAPLPQAPVAGTVINRLHYVRLNEDTEEATVFFEGHITRKVSVIELPNEYAAAVLGFQPIYLFHFWATAPVYSDWYYTSFAAPVGSLNKIYQNFPIDFSNLTQTADASSDGCDIEAQPDPNHPFSLFLPFPFSGVLFVDIFTVDFNTPDVQTKLFSGRVVSVEDQGTKLAAKCESRLGYLRRKIPRYLKGSSCQNQLYDPQTCKAGRAFFQTPVGIAAMSDAYTFPPTVTCTFLLPEFQAKYQADDYLTNGMIESGVGKNYEARSIIASSYDAGSGHLTLTLNAPFNRTQVGANAQVVAGCDHQAMTCQAKFNNYANFNGFVAIPPRNPVLKALNANPVSQGGK